MAEYIHPPPGTPSTCHPRHHRPTKQPQPTTSPKQHFTLLFLHALASLLHLLILLTTHFLPLTTTLYTHISTLLSSLRTATFHGIPHFDILLAAYLLVYFPAWVWWAVKVVAKGLLGHLVFGMLAVRWFERCKGEWVPVVRVGGWEVVLREGEREEKEEGKEGKEKEKMV